MATYNGVGLVEETIRSLLRQSYTDFELVAVDDCSTDGTPDILRGFGDRRIRVLSTKRNAGPVGARNIAVQAARGEYLAALDQDDLCMPDRFARQLAYLDSHPAVVVLGTAARRLVDGRMSDDRVPGPTTPGFIRWLLHVRNPLIWSSVMIRAAAAHQLPVFNREDRQYAEDYCLYHRLAALGEVARLDEPLTTYRWHEGGVSQRHEGVMLGRAAAVLAEAYAPWFGDGAPEAARLMIRHVGAKQEVTDAATLHRLREIVGVVNVMFGERYRPDDETRQLIARETGRLWRRLIRGRLRSQLRRGQEALLFEKRSKNFY